MNDFYGLPTGILENDFIQLEYLATSGPRIVRFSAQGDRTCLLPKSGITTGLVGWLTVWTVSCSARRSTSIRVKTIQMMAATQNHFAMTSLWNWNV
jgi:hypothetical protein